MSPESRVESCHSSGSVSDVDAHVLGARVQRLSKRLLLLGGVGPVSGKVLVGETPEQVTTGPFEPKPPLATG